VIEVVTLIIKERSLADPVALGALELLAMAYERQGDLEKELQSYELIAKRNWLRGFTVQQRDRMLDRIRNLAGILLAGRPDDQDAAVTIRAATAILRLRKSLLMDQIYTGGEADVIAVEALLGRAEAHERSGDHGAAYDDLLSAVRTPSAQMLDGRFRAAVAFVAADDAAGAQNPGGLLRAILTTDDDGAAYVCVAALAVKAVAKGEAGPARAWTRALFSLCREDEAQVAVLCDVAKRLAAAGAELGLTAEAVAGLQGYAAQGPKGLDGRWHSGDDLVFPLGALAGALARADAVAIEQCLRDDALKPRLRVRLLIILGDITGALKESYRTYAQAEKGRNVQVEAVYDFVATAKARNGRFLDPDPYLAFMAFGPAGPDEADGSADNIDDPFTQVLIALHRPQS
jgi:hypothetical protein